MNRDRDIIRPENAKCLEDCWQCSNDDEAQRMAKYLKETFKISVKVVSLFDCKDLEDKQ